VRMSPGGRMRRTVAVLAFTLLSGTLVLGQDAGAVILTYQRNFVRSSLATKLELLKEAGKSGGSEMGPLYDTALSFVLDNAGLLGDDAQLRDLALLAVRKAGEVGQARSAGDIWSVFQVYKSDSELRAAAVLAYARTGTGQPTTVADLSGFLASQNSLFRSGLQPDYPAFEATLEALGLLGDPSSYQVLFASYVAAPTPTVRTKAAAALSKLKGDLRAYLEEVIAKGAALEKTAALELGFASPALGSEDQGRLAEAALASSLDWKGDSPVEQAAMRKLRLASVRQIGALHWQRAAPLAIRHFRLLLGDYQDGKGAEEDLLDAITCLGAMGSSDAALALSLYLQLINGQTEQGKPYDQALLLGVIRALGSLGDKVAFDYLLYIGYLQYPEAIKDAAKEALQDLKW